MLCEGFSAEQLLVLFLYQAALQMKMMVDDKVPSRGSVRCGLPSAEAKEIVSILYMTTSKKTDLFSYKHFLFLIYCHLQTRLR